MTTLSRLLAQGTFLTAIVACASKPVDSGTDAIGIVAALNDRLDSAYRHGNADSAVALMTDSVVISPEGFPDVRGRAAVRDLLRVFFGGNTVAAFTLQPTELRIHGDYAYERGTFVFAAGPKNATLTQRSGRYSVMRLRQRDGTWQIHRYLENSLSAQK